MANIKACFTTAPFQTKIPSFCRLRRRQRRFYPTYHIYLRDHHPFDYKPDTIPETNRIRYYAYSGWLSRQFRQQEGVSLEPYSFRCQRHGEMSRFRQDKMSHFLHRLCEKSKSWIAGPAAAKGKHGDGPVAIQITRGGQPFRWREVLL